MKKVIEKGYNMFFKKNRSVEFTGRIEKKDNVPILIYDKNWKQMFLNNSNRTIEGLSKELEKLINEQKEMEKNFKDYQQRKRTLMNKIIHMSAKLNIKDENVSETELEAAKSEIEDLNDAIDEIRFRVETHPQKIEHTNMKLLEETAKIAYLEIDKAEARIETVDKEIAKLREKLGEYWDEKEALEKKAQTHYSLLHSIIGSEEIEKIDKDFFGDQEEYD